MTKQLLADYTTQDFIPIGDELIFGRLFNEVGCGKIFKNLKITGDLFYSTYIK